MSAASRSFLLWLLASVSTGRHSRVHSSSLLDLLGIMQSDGVETTQLVPQDVVFGGDPTFLEVPCAATLDGLEDHDVVHSTSGYGFGQHDFLPHAFSWCIQHCSLVGLVPRSQLRFKSNPVLCSLPRIHRRLKPRVEEG